MADDERRAEIEAPEAILNRIIEAMSRAGADGTLPAEKVRVECLRAIYALRVRDARGGRPDCEHGYFAAGGTNTCPACDADALDYLERRKVEPIYEAHTIEALAEAQETNAEVWATAFVAAAARTPEMPYDFETMLSWFAVAIMAGYERGKADSAAARSPHGEDDEADQ